MDKNLVMAILMLTIGIFAICTGLITDNLKLGIINIILGIFDCVFAGYRFSQRSR